MKDGRRFGGPPKPYQPPSSPRGEVNLTDPDARVMKAFRGYVQGYNVQAAVNEQHIVLAAEITVESVDFSQLKPMVDATLRELGRAGIREKPRAAVADARYWNEQHMDEVIGEHGIPVLIPPDSSRRKGERPGWTGGRYTFMRRVLERPPRSLSRCANSSANASCQATPKATARQPHAPPRSRPHNCSAPPGHASGSAPAAAGSLLEPVLGACSGRESHRIGQ